MTHTAAQHPEPLETLADATDDRGTVPYGLAAATAAAFGLDDRFLHVYGLPGDWEDVETGWPIGIDSGELTVWILEQAA